MNSQILSLLSEQLKFRHVTYRIVCLLMMCLILLTSGCEQDAPIEETAPVQQPAIRRDNAAKPLIPNTPKEPEQSNTPEPAPPNAADVLATFNKILPQARTDADVETLASLTTGLDQVTELDFTGSKISLRSIQHFPKFPALHKLVLAKLKFSPAVYLELSKLAQLEELSFEHSNITDQSLACLQQMPNLKRLNLNYTAVTDAGFEYFKGLNQLEELYLNRTKIDGSGFSKISHFTQVMRLSASQTNFGIAGFQFIKDWKMLNYLALTRAAVKDNVMSDISELINLREVLLAYNAITNSGLTHLSALENIEILHLENNGAITGKGLRALMKCKKLKYLNINSTSATSKDVTLMKQYFKEAKIMYAGELE